MEFCVQFWASQFKRARVIPECIQQKGAKMIRGVEPLSHEERLRDLDLFCQKKRRLGGDIVQVYESLMGGCQEDGAMLFLMVLSNRTRGTKQKTMHRKFYPNTRKNFLTAPCTR